MKCKECKYCKQIGRQRSQRLRIGRKRYYCENSKVYENEEIQNNFVGYGDMTIESPLKLKTSKKWCPLKGENDE